MSGYPPPQPPQQPQPPQGQNPYYQGQPPASFPPPPGQGTYPQQPYPPQPYGQQAYYAQQPVNTGIPGVIIAGFIFSFLCPLISWICIGVGWKEIERRGGAGKGLAIAGLIISFLNVAANVGLRVSSM